MRHYRSSFSGYKYVIRPRKKRIINGEVIFEDGLHAKFEDGRFSTDIPEIIRALDAYSKTHPEEITMVAEPKNMEDVVKTALDKMDGDTKQRVIDAIKKQAKKEDDEKNAIAENEKKKYNSRRSRTKVQTEGR